LLNLTLSTDFRDSESLCLKLGLDFCAGSRAVLHSLLTWKEQSHC